MTRSDEPTGYIYIRASSPSEWDCCDFAVFAITDAWLDLMEERLELLQPFLERDDFYSHEYWDGPEGYFVHSYEDDQPETQLLDDDGEEWCFADLEPGELDLLPKPEAALSTNQLVVTKSGYGYFSALGKHTGEEYYTASFAIAELLNYFRAPRQNMYGR